MKKFWLIILTPIITFAQLEHRGELRIDLFNHGSTWNVTISLTAYSARWDENYNLTEYYEYASDNVTNPTESAYFEHVLDPSQYHEEFAIGLYKITAIENGVEQAYFWMDWRTSDWSTSLDVRFKYDVNNNRFRDINNTQTLNYTYQTLWDLTDNELETTGLEDYWDNCLALIPSVNNNPRLIWGPYPESVDLSGYNIYRKVGSGNFSLIHFNYESQLEYTDTEYSITYPTGAQLQYYVKAAFVDDGLSSPTNTVTTSGMINLKDKSENKFISYGYSLSSNYPNPFNPSTMITYTLPENSFVILKVYDVLGRDIVTLVNENKEAGNHSVMFNASGLPSGIYLYKIQSGNFLEIRKMILQK
jgi:hypothetical protein